MFVIKRNQVVVTALAVMIAAAGYLNFQESRSSESNQTALQLTEEGDALKEQAIDVPYRLEASLDMDREEAYQLYRLLCEFLGREAK